MPSGVNHIKRPASCIKLLSQSLHGCHERNTQPSPSPACSKFDLSQFDAAASTDSATVQTHSHGGLRNEPPHADLKDIEGATVKSWQYILGTPSLLEGLESRQALLDWLELLAAYHPVPR